MSKTNLEKIKNSINIWKVVRQPKDYFASYYQYNHKMSWFECSYDNENWIKSSLYINAWFAREFNNCVIEEIVPVLTNLDKVKNSENVWEVIYDSNLGLKLSRFYRYNHNLKYYELSDDLKKWYKSLIGCSGDTTFNNATIKELIQEKESEKVDNNLSPLEQLVINPNTDYVLLDKDNNIVSIYKWSHSDDLFVKQNHIYIRFNLTHFIVNVNYVLQDGGKFCKLSEHHNKQTSQVLTKLHNVQSPRGITLVTQTDYNTKQYMFDVKPTQNIDLNGSFKNVNQTLLNEKLTIQEIDREIELLQYVKELKKVIEENK